MNRKTLRLLLGKPKLFLGKQISKHSVLVFVIILLLLIFIIGGIFRGTLFGKFVGNMFSAGGPLKDFFDKPLTWHEGIRAIFAYLIGTIIISGFIIAVLTNNLRSMGERYQNGDFKRYNWKDHVLFLGYDDLMFGTLKDACNNSLCDIIIAVPNNVKRMRAKLKTVLTGSELERVELIQCNRCDADNLEKKARIHKAKKIFIIGQPDEPTHDALNMKSLAEVANRCAKENAFPHVMVYLKNQSSFSLIQKQGLDAQKLSALVNGGVIDNSDFGKFIEDNCECFNFYTDRALRLFSDIKGMRPDWHSDTKNLSNKDYGTSQVHLVVIGMTKMGVALIRAALLLAHPSGKGTRFLITMVDDKACEEMHYFMGRTKELFKHCRFSYCNYDNPSKDFQITPDPDKDFLDVEFEFVQCDAAHPTLIKNLTKWAINDKQLLTLAVCSDKSSKNLAVALYLPNNLLYGEYAIPTWIYQEGDDSMNQLLSEEQYPSLHTFSLADHVVTDISTSKVYEKARNVARFYENKYGTFNKKWDEMSTDYKWSSIYCVLSMEIKLRAVGIKGVAADDENLKEQVDIIEHNRWVVEKLSNGFVPTTSEQHTSVKKELDELKKVHSDWGKSESVCNNDIEKNRVLFKNLKDGKTVPNVKIHDDIRPFNELDPYTQKKDRFFLENYINSFFST